MDMGFAPTWLRQVSPPASQNHFNHWGHGPFKNFAASAALEHVGGVQVILAFLVRVSQILANHSFCNLHPSIQSTL